MDSFFDFPRYKELLLAKKFDILQNELQVYCNIRLLNYSSESAVPVALYDVCMRLFIALLRYPECNAANQLFFTRQKLMPNEYVPKMLSSDVKPVLPLYEAISVNNTAMVAFLFERGAVLQLLDMDYNPALDAICQPHVESLTFQQVVRTMKLTAALPSIWVLKPALKADMELTIPKIQLLLDQGADFMVWNMHHHAATLDVLCWMIAQKFINTGENTLVLELILHYINKQKHVLAAHLVQFLTHVPNDHLLFLFDYFVRAKEDDEGYYASTLDRLLLAIGPDRLRSPKTLIHNYPLLLYCASLNKMTACQLLVRHGVYKKMVVPHVFSSNETGETVARANKFFDLASWFAEEPPPILIQKTNVSDAVDEMVKDE
jgi:hypothetical protein